jgi:hypothetical protein
MAHLRGCILRAEVELRIFAVSVWLALATGCWKTERSSLPEGQVAFEPAAGAAEGWIVQTLDVPIECPDGENSHFYLVYPEGTTTSLPVAVVLHSGSFDYVPLPSAVDPLSGTHFQEESRLSGAWATYRVFQTLGMYPDDDLYEDTTGALPAALTEQGVALILPGNCWGDWWHNYQSLADNDFAADRFYRNGRAAAEWAWRTASEPGFAEQNGITLPISFVSGEAFAVGIGEGGRGVAELLNAGYQPNGVLVDSTIDDLRPFWTATNNGLYSGITAGLLRMFAGMEDTYLTSLADAPWLPPRTVFVHSSLDPQIPAGANDAILGRLATQPEAWVYDAALPSHVITQTDLELARQAVAWMTEGVLPVDTGGDDTGGDDTGADDTAGDDTSSGDTGNGDTGGGDTGAEGDTADSGAGARTPDRCRP